MLPDIGVREGGDVVQDLEMEGLQFLRGGGGRRIGEDGVEDGVVRRTARVLEVED